MVDASARRDPLPSLTYLDLEKVKRETSGYNHYTPTSINMPAPPLTSPSTTYSGPPPPYSYPSSASSSIVGNNNAVTGPPAPGTHSFSQHRPGFPDDKERTYITPKQTLPPINEALSIHSILNSTTASRPSIPAHSPTSPTHRPPAEPIDQPRTESQQRQSPKSARSFDSKPPSMNSFSPHIANNYGSSNHISHPLNHVSTSQASRSISDYVSHHGTFANNHQSNQLPPPPPAQTSPTTAEPGSYASAYQYQPAYSYPPSTPTVKSYDRPFFDVMRNGHTIDQERAEEVRKAIPKDSPPNKAYGLEVKRHLDNFEFETSLNEIAEGCGRALEFSRHYGTRAHQTQRSGPIPGSLPSLNECDQIIRQQSRVLESMTRIREIILKQQQALAEQKRYDEQNFKPPREEPEQENQSFADRSEGGGGFAGSDPKKRRGRAAPPGRCHSCNRAETPEWRRGPDGARTLCNACGLHYAKVTRKLGNKNGAGSSNLRPKEDVSSP